MSSLLMSCSTACRPGYAIVSASAATIKPANMKTYMLETGAGVRSAESGLSERIGKPDIAQHNLSTPSLTGIAGTSPRAVHMHAASASLIVAPCPHQDGRAASALHKPAAESAPNGTSHQTCCSVHT